VFLARHVRLDRLVAIKVLHAGSYDQEGQRRLEREGRAVASLRHPNIVAVHELRSTPAGYALVMEYLPGGDLRGLMDSGSLTGSHAVQLLNEIAAGLAHAHAAGVVHRDVKPANVLISAEGHAKVGDFGLARLSQAAGVFRTVDGTARGSPTYLAPEQILDPTRESPAADAYSFAVLAYEVVVGRRPFAARTVAAMINMQLNEVPAPPRTLAPGLPDEVERRLLAGLDKRPVARPSPRQLAESLDAFKPAEWDVWFAARGTVSDTVDTPAAADVTQTAAYDVAAAAAATGGSGPTAAIITTSRSASPSAASSIPRRPVARGGGRRRPPIALLVCAMLIGVLVGLAVVLVARQL
jgi:serine/threonine-protein kinase